MKLKSTLALFAVAGSALLSLPAQAQTLIGGGKGGTSFPITLTQSGSYKLAGNLVVPPGVDGIVVASGLSVSIDMNGFEISGPVLCSKTGCNAATYQAGIRVGASSARIVRGTVRGFGGAGVGRTSGELSRVSLEDMVLAGNLIGVNAITLNGTRIEVRDNAFHGIDANRAVLVDSIALKNGGTGVKVGGGTLRSVISLENGQYGFDLDFGVYDLLVAQLNASGNRFNGAAGVNGLY